MKKVVLTMVALLSMTAAMAQSENGERKARKRMTPTEMTSQMTKELNLTDDQKSKIQSLNEEYKDYLTGPVGMGPGKRGQRPDGNTGATQQQGQEKRQRPELSDEQKAEMKQHMAKREEYNAKLKGILTDDQYKTYQKQHMRRGPGGPRGGKSKDRSSND